MRDLVSEITSRQRYSALLLGIFAALALILSIMGIYGVVTYSTSARTREIGIRMAMGARERDIFQLVMRDAAILILTGSTLGTLAAILATRLLSSQLYQLSATDPLTFASVLLLLICVALIACFIPARRAMKVNPAITLRRE
jgi:putative ABC transport system permease protein